jgi:crossover junction endodeoxyribonuclease RusA
MVLSQKGREFKQSVAEYVIENCVPKLGDAKLKITIIMRPRDKRKTDVDSRIKATLDALECAGVFDDDYQVEHLEVIRGEPIKDGKIVVTIEEIV